MCSCAESPCVRTPGAAKLCVFDYNSASFQDEDVEGPRHRGKKKGPHGAAAYRGTVQQLGGMQDPDIIREIVISPVDSDPLPTLFVSHGLGPMPLLRDPSAPFPRSLAELPQRLRLDEHLVRCILVISAHWESRDGLEVTLRRTHAQGLLYDYAGASKEMYEVHHRYHPPGDPQVSGWVVDLLQEANQEIRVNSARALDHGVFVPLLLMPSLASVPVVQLSLPGFHGRRGSELARQCLEVGRALSPLRSRGVLILGSGLSTNSATKPERLERWTEELTRLCSASSEERFEGLRTWTSTLPHAREVHGREEHLLPLHVAAGAARDDPGEALCHCVEHGLVMSHFVFGWWRRTRHPPLENSQLPMDDDELMQREDSSRSDKEVQKIIQAAKRRQLEEASLLGLEGVPSVSGPRLTDANQRGFSSLSSGRSRPQTAGRSAAQVPRPRAQGRNWRGVERPPSARLEFERMDDSTADQRFHLQSGPGPSRAHHLGCAAGHSTQYSCKSEVWWQKSPAADRRRQGDFERCTLPSQQPSWESEVGYGAEEASGHWPSGRPRKAGDLPPLPGAEGGKAQSLGLFIVPPPEAPQPAWAKSSIQPQEGGA
ncbi:DODA [Symbiodinium sp. CCMP2592]|nr:DODA [Symbiodinium sp. CCMP2592]